MRLDAWIDRIKEVVDCDVRSAGDLASITADYQRDGVWVFYISDTAGANSLVNAVRQQRTYRVGVMLAMVDFRSGTGAEGAEKIENLRAKIMGVLHGWQPTDETDQVVFRAGRSYSLANNVVWWLDEFEVTELLSTI